jgi:membrane associated rhomboid family serine protease
MSSGADLFVVCKQCGSEVSPYITECPYCGSRLRRRAPKLPREGQPPKRSRRPVSSLGRLRAGEIPGLRADAPPYATIALVTVGCVAWVLLRGGFIHDGFFPLEIRGPLNGDWWRLITCQFAFESGFYAFVVLAATGLFGWLLERRHGPFVVLLVFFACGISGALAELAIATDPVVSGGTGAALGLLAAWAVPDLLAKRRGEDYEGDLLGTAVIAAVLLAMPLARTEASEIATVTGGLVGLLLGYGLATLRPGA